jgi:hypothetical protein
MSKRNTIRLLFGLAAIGVPLFLIAEEKVDLSIVSRIKSEAFENSKVMDHMFYLTDVHGPRLTGSPNYKAAADWVIQRMTEYGLAAHEEKWGPFGRGWANKHFEAHLIEPQYQPLIGVPLAWTAGTDGTITGEPIVVSIRTDADFDKYKGKLNGKIIMSMAPKEMELETAPLGHRYTDEELADEARAPQPGRSPFSLRAPGNPAGGPPATPEEARQRREERRKFGEKVAQFYKDEGALVLLSYGYNGDGGTIFASSGGSYDPKKPIALAAVALTPEHYNRIARLMEHKIPVKLQFNIQNQFYEDNPESVNVVAEIPGNSKKDEIVMLGAHLDSWHGGTGATDNAAGSAVVMEAARILKSLNLPMDRTVRMALWGGEEEGLLGSRAYVKEHFADRETMKLSAERDLPSRERHGAADLPGLAGAVQGSGRDNGHHSQHGRHRSPVVRCGRLAGLSVHPRSDGLQHAHASFEHGCVRSHSARRSDAGFGDHGVVCLQCRDARRDAAAQAAAEATAGTAPSRRH